MIAIRMKMKNEEKHMHLQSQRGLFRKHWKIKEREQYKHWESGTISPVSWFYLFII